MALHSNSGTYMPEKRSKSYNPRPFHLIMLEVGDVFLAGSVVLHLLLELGVARLLRRELLRRLRQILLDATLRLAGGLQMLVIAVQLLSLIHI